jgi:formate hydrogenlyase subunit 3/multisubunit Na+/H+ antiporter MnhD subunit
MNTLELDAGLSLAPTSGLWLFAGSLVEYPAREEGVMRITIMDPLLLTAAVPLAGFLIALILPDALNRLRWIVTVVTTAITLDFAVRIMVLTTPGTVVTGGEDLSFIVLGPFVGADKVVPLFFADNLSTLMAAAVSTAAFLVSVYMYETPVKYGNGRAFLSYFLLGLAGTNTALLAGNALVLVIGWMLAGLSLLLLVSRVQEVTPGLSSAWFRTVMLLGLGDIALLFGVFIMLYADPGTAGDLSGAYSKGLLLTMGDHGTAEAFFIIALMIAAVAKTACVPFHSWLPALSAKMPAALPAFLPACAGMTLGTYILARLTMSLYRQYSLPLWTWEVLLAVGVLTMLWGVVMAAAENDLKKIFSYLTISQMGFAVAGIGTGVSVGTAGGVIQVVNAIIFMPALFMVAGNIEHSTGLVQIDQMKGLGRRMPSTSIAFLLAAAAATGVPPMSGFTSKWMIFQGLIEIGRPILLLFAMIGTAATFLVFARIGWRLLAPMDRHNVTAPVLVPAPLTSPALLLGMAALVTGIVPWLMTSLLGVLPGQAESLWEPAWALTLVLVSIVAAIVVVLMPSLSKVDASETENTAQTKAPVRTPEDVLHSFEALAGTLVSNKYDVYLLVSRTAAGVRDHIGACGEGRVSRYAAYAFLSLGAIMSVIYVWIL